MEKITDSVESHLGIIEGIEVAGEVKLKLNPGKSCLANKLKMMIVDSSR